MTDTGSTAADAASAVRHQLGPYGLEVASGFGPRVVSLRRDDSPGIFVELPAEVSVAHPSGEAFQFRGGHRLWVSPEDPAFTYAPDNHQCTVTSQADSLTISAPPDVAGFEKSIHLSWTGNRLNVEHWLRWVGEHPIEASPWAITQLPPGGVAILPVAAADGGSPLQADRSLVIWPYTRLDDERIAWRESSALIQAGPGEPLKLGSGPAPGAVGYLKDGYLFTKRFDPPEGEHPDRGAIAQIYVNDIFCELESLGPMVRLEPGEETHHIEIWDVTRCPDLGSAVSTVSR